MLIGDDSGSEGEGALIVDATSGAVRSLVACNRVVGGGEGAEVGDAAAILRLIVRNRVVRGGEGA